MDWSFLIRNKESIHVTTDSRKVTSGSVFVALKGEHFDGNDFVEQAKADGAEYIICAFHWGQELYYKPNAAQKDLAHACIDAGANLIYGSHTHCLQPIELYNGSLILYSCGNWIFGGSTMPSDPDTALFQVTLKRGEDGSLKRTGAVNVIPCCVSSKLDEAERKAQNYNDYCPTPYETDSEEFNRVFSKLTGEYEPTSQGADYSDWLLSRAAASFASVPPRPFCTMICTAAFIR